MTTIFPWIVGTLCVAAAAVYVYQGDYRQAITWACFGVADYALGWP